MGIFAIIPSNGVRRPSNGVRELEALDALTGVRGVPPDAMVPNFVLHSLSTIIV